MIEWLPAKGRTYSEQKFYVRFHFYRLLNMSHLERFIVWRNDGLRVGFITLINDKSTWHLDFLIEVNLRKGTISDILQRFEAQFVPDWESRKDLIIGVWRSRELLTFFDHAPQGKKPQDAIQIYDLHDLTKKLEKVVGRLQSARGGLAEHGVVEYFQRLGFQARLAEQIEDANGADVLAQRDNKYFLVQVKLGTFGRKALSKIIGYAKSISSSIEAKIYIFFVCGKFPAHFWLDRLNLEDKTDIKIIGVRLVELFQVVPTYLHAIGTGEDL